jgi:hypothetical protein
MRKLITGALILLILISLYGLLKMGFDFQQVKPTPAMAVAITPTPGPKMLIVSTTPTPDPAPQSTPAPAPVSTSTLEPLKSRLVKHQPDQFRKGAISDEELSAIRKAIKTIPWSRNSNPQAAANEDYAAILKECEKSSVHDLLTDLITEAVSNDYQPNDQAANGAYSAELNSDFEKGDQSDHSNEKSTGEIAAGQVTSVDSGLTPAVSEPDVPAKATLCSPVQQRTSAEVIRSKIGHVRHRLSVRHRIVDVKKRLLELWHQSLAQTEKAPKWTLFTNSHEGETNK